VPHLDFTGRASLVAALSFLAFISAAALTSQSAHAQSSSCTNCYTSSIAAPTGYGASYNVFSLQHELLVSVGCSSAAPLLTVGSNQSNQYVYKQGYVYQNNAWQVLTLTSSNILVNNAWYPSLATVSLPTPTSSWTYVVGYVCQWSGTAWQCGCHDERGHGF
jgi:hypothetical protein